MWCLAIAVVILVLLLCNCGCGGDGFSVQTDAQIAVLREKIKLLNAQVDARRKSGAQNLAADQNALLEIEKANTAINELIQRDLEINQRAEQIAAASMYEQPVIVPYFVGGGGYRSGWRGRHHRRWH